MFGQGKTNGKWEHLWTNVSRYGLRKAVGRGPWNSMLNLSIGCVALMNVPSCGLFNLSSTMHRPCTSHTQTFLTFLVEKGELLDLTKCSRRVTPGWQWPSRSSVNADDVETRLRNSKMQGWRQQEPHSPYHVNNVPYNLGFEFQSPFLDLVVLKSWCVYVCRTYRIRNVGQ